MLLGRVLLWVAGVMFLGFGFGYLFAPASLAEPAGFSLLAPSALADVRATYGGFALGLAAFLIWSARVPQRMPAGLLALALIEAGVGLCRALGVLIEGAMNRFHITAFLIEIGLAVLALGAFVRLHKSVDLERP
jgi:hypothetical protein